MGEILAQKTVQTLVSRDCSVCLRRQVCNSKSTQNLAAFRLAPSHWLLWDFC